MINFILRPGDRFRNLIKIIDPNDDILPEITDQLKLTMDKKTGEIYVVRFLITYSIEKIDINYKRKLTTKVSKSLTSWFTTRVLGEFLNRVNLIDFVNPRAVHEFIKELKVTTILRVPVRLTSDVYQIIPEADKELLKNYTSIPDLTQGARYYYKNPSKPNI